MFTSLFLRRAVAADADLQIILDLQVGKGVRFDADSNAWAPWG